MPKTMAEIILEHDDDAVMDGYWFCTGCDYEYGVFAGFGIAKAEHIQQKLQEEGYGLLNANS